MHRCAAWLLVCCALACGRNPAVPPSAQARTRTPHARAWPEADALFRGDARFRGADAAISVALAPDRILWLFGDSFVASDVKSRRSDAKFVHNSLAIQRGADPSRAELSFYAGTGHDAAPASFFADEAESWFWPGHAVYLDHVLTVFLERMQASAQRNALGFRSAGWTAVRIRNAELEPSAWIAERLATPDTGALGIVGASVLVEGAFVVAYAVIEPGKHAISLLRWPLAAFNRGELLALQYFMGPKAGWGSGPPAVVISAGATEFSVARVASGSAAGLYAEVQSRGFGAAPISARFAPAPEGPFGAPIDLYLPPEARRAHVLLYAGRAHAELPGADLVLTYASNSLESGQLLADEALYFPRFVRVDWR